MAQLKGVVKDSENGAPIAYANIQILNKNSGVSADEQGRFLLADRDTTALLVISATGYEPMQVTYGKDLVVKLRKAHIQLQEVVIGNKRNNNLLKIGSYKKSHIKVHFAVKKSPWILVRYFPYNPSYKNTPFLKSVMIETNSHVRDAVFNLKFYQKGADGLPGEFLYNENIIVHAEKGRRNTIADISSCNIAFPEEGCFVGVEFMLIEQNQYTIDVVEKGVKRSHKEINFEPKIGALPSDVGDHAMIFNKGKWEKMWQNDDPFIPKAYQGKYNLFAIELTLSE